MNWLRSLPTERVLLLLVVLASVVVYLPSFGVYFFADDLDRIGGLAYARESNALLRYLITPQNDHFEPSVKSLLVLSMQIFGTAAHLPLHGLLLLSLAGCIFVLYRLAKELFENRESALFAASLFGLSTVYAEAVFFVSGSNLYVLLFSLVTLYSMLRYAQEEKRIYQWTALLAAFLATATMASSYLLGVWIILFFLLCVRERKSAIFLPPLAGWALGLGVIAALHGIAILRAPHYQMWQRDSALEIFSLSQGMLLSSHAFVWLLRKYSWTLPVLLIAFLPALSAVLYIRRIRWRAVLFFALFIFGNYFIVYAFRHPWGPDIVKWQRNHLPGAWGYAMIFAGLTAPLLQRLLDRRRELFAPVLICFAALHGSYNALLLPRLLPDTTDTQNIVRESQAFAQYFQENPGERSLTVHDIQISLRSYGRKPLSDLLIWMVPGEVRQRIEWRGRTDPSFVRFLEKNQKEYPTLSRLVANNRHREAVQSQEPAWQISLGDPRVIARYEGTETDPNLQAHHFCGMLRAQNGNLIVLYGLLPDQLPPTDRPLEEYLRKSVGYRISWDGGRTWSRQRELDRGNTKGGAFPDGSLYIPDYYSEWVNDHEIRMQAHRSRDDGLTWRLDPDVRVRFPSHRKVKRLDPNASMYFYGNLLTLDDRSVVAPMYGQFTDSEQVRTILIRTRDAGRSWEFYSCVAGDRPSGHQGFSEPTIARLASGELLCVMRTEYEPARRLAQCRSRDGGRTWTEPEPAPGIPGLAPEDHDYTTPDGKPGHFDAGNVSPMLALLPNGILAMVYGRPGVKVALSADGTGRRWDRIVEIVPRAYRHSYSPHDVTTAMAGIVPVGRDRLLLVYDVYNYAAKPTDPRVNTIFARTLTVRR